MAKVKNSKKRHDVGKTITTPSAYGSHKSMVVDHSQFDLTLSEQDVLCKDETHYYITQRNRLDTGLADPNRYSERYSYEP